MDKRELLALMAAIIYAGESGDGQGLNINPVESVREANAVLNATDALLRERWRALKKPIVAGEGDEE